MERLAPEIKILILRNVDKDAKTLISCASVSRAWRSAAQMVLFEKYPMYTDRTKSADFLECWQAKDGVIPFVRTLVFNMLPLMAGAPRVADIHNIWANGHFARLSNLDQLFLGPRLLALSELGVANEFVVTLLPPHPVAFAPLPVLTRLTRLTLTGIRFETVKTLQVLLCSLPALTHLRLISVGWLAGAHADVGRLSADMPLRGLAIAITEPEPNYAAFMMLYAWILWLPAVKTLEDVSYENPDMDEEDPFAGFVACLSHVPGPALSVSFPHTVISTAIGPLDIALDLGPRVTTMMIELPADDGVAPMPGCGFDLHQLSSISAPGVRTLTLQLVSDLEDAIYERDLDALDPPFAHFGALERLVVVPQPPIEILWCTKSMLGVVAACGRQVAVTFEGGVKTPDHDPVWEEAEPEPDAEAEDED